jgi:hypothetical protein
MTKSLRVDGHAPPVEGHRRDLGRRAHEVHREAPEQDQRPPDVEAARQLHGRQVEDARHEEREHDAGDHGDDRDVAPEQEPQDHEPDEERQLHEEGQALGAGAGPARAHSTPPGNTVST